MEYVARERERLRVQAGGADQSALSPDEEKLLIEAGVKKTEYTYSFDPVNDLAAKAFELWQLLRHQSIFDFGVPIALNFATVFQVFDEYEIYENRLWFFEMLVTMSEQIFSAMAESTRKPGR
jgi:hypothetical protein